MVIVVDINNNGYPVEDDLEKLRYNLELGWKVVTETEVRKRNGMSNCNVTSCVIYTLEYK